MMYLTPLIILSVSSCCSPYGVHAVNFEDYYLSSDWRHDNRVHPGGLQTKSLGHITSTRTKGIVKAKSD
ncbi:hypothetical protein BDV33DRAFT_167128 [Aspergillus novoparasiticus]|uniref:Secreted protein n=1 Tax=Aspergillus novoparasiticus TaxID=986946 RepID=A0A5N6F194_9EURO|nr:hypothetical protein BDV33DRAFT_167128 [Aspergillus novoparasiticus]